MTATVTDLEAHAKTILGASIISSSTAFGELTLIVARESITEVLTKLRDGEG